MLPENIVVRLEALRDAGTSIRKMVALLSLSRNTVRRYVRRGRPAKRVEPQWHSHAIELFETRCKGNASAVARILATEGVTVTARTVQRLVRAKRLHSTPPPSMESTTSMQTSAAPPKLTELSAHLPSYPTAQTG